MNTEQKPFLSFCIPTYDRLEILHSTIESIYADLDGVELDEFEVIVSDNKPDQSAKKVIEKFSHKNLFYFSTDSSGFLNSFNSLKCGNGQFLKLHNNYTKLRRGTLRKMIGDVKENAAAKGLIFYTDGLNQNGEIKKFSTFDAFMHDLTYFSSWSSGFGIWRDDFSKIFDSIKIDEFFPQTSLLLSQSKKNNYIINDRPIFDNQKIPKKGGYNIFKVFSVDYVSLIEKSYLTGDITKDTFRKIKLNLLYN
ncbi:MAG: glycosyltransferase, partial [Pedobacter sp.]